MGLRESQRSAGRCPEKEAIVRKTLAMLGLVVAATAMLSSAADASAAKAQKEVRYVRLVAENGFYVDNDPSGSSGGDLFGSTGQLTHGGSQVGTFSSTCTAASAEVGQCQVTFAWNSGDRIQAAGEIRMQELKNHVSITGGTRKYKRARGDVTLTRLDDQGQVQRVRLRILR
jgi:hypothetical protein